MKHLCIPKMGERRIIYPKRNKEWREVSRPKVQADPVLQHIDIKKLKKTGMGPDPRCKNCLEAVKVKGDGRGAKNRVEIPFTIYKVD